MLSLGTPSQRGGGLYNIGNVTLISSTVANNTAYVRSQRISPPRYPSPPSRSPLMAVSLSHTRTRLPPPRARLLWPSLLSPSGAGRRRPSVGGGKLCGGLGALQR